MSAAAVTWARDLIRQRTLDSANAKLLLWVLADHAGADGPPWRATADPYDVALAMGWYAPRGKAMQTAQQQLVDAGLVVIEGDTFTLNPGGRS